MGANYKTYRVRVMLECGHVVSHKVEYPFRVPPEWIRCNYCKADVAIYAFELKEWKARCTKCRYSRFTGQSESDARRIQQAHFVSKAHPVSVTYNINPELFEIVRHHYKRRYQFTLPEFPPPIRFPRMRNRDDDTDIPPF